MKRGEGCGKQYDIDSKHIAVWLIWMLAERTVRRPEAGSKRLATGEWRMPAGGRSPLVTERARGT